MGGATVEIQDKRIDVSVDPFKPVEAQVEEADGTIFVSIASYRDGERCGRTLKSLFENAKNPGKIFVGLIEQNHADDKFCLEEYCASYGATTLERQRVRADTTKIVTVPAGREKCPYYDHVRLLGLHHYAAKGPVYARSFARKLLGNEEFCMQLDAHSEVEPGWDEISISEWKKTGNEFGIISHLPVSVEAKDDESYERSTPRQCRIVIRDNGFPDYEGWDDVGVAHDLEAPLLAYTWSAAFSFAKCHLEESAPYDPFSWYAQPIEQFSRFARFWTRGYDVYTPTRAIAYHDYGSQENGHGSNEWFKRQRDRFRKEALVRAKTLIQLPDGMTSSSAKANMGIYGIGKRRTLQHLMEFVGVSTNPLSANKGAACGFVKYVPYDAQVSPVANMFDDPDNLEPQPEYPLRTKLTYYEQVDNLVASPMLGINENGTSSDRAVQYDVHNIDTFGQTAGTVSGRGESSNLPSLSMILLLWCFGLLVWCSVFMNPIEAQVVKRKLKRVVKEANFKEI